MAKKQRSVRIRRMLAAGAASVLGAALLTAAPAPAAAAGCYDQGCNGEDPYAMGCVNDAVMVSLDYVQTSTGTGRAEHWHSPACMADWATTRIYSGPTDNAWAGIQQAPWGVGALYGQYSDTTRYDLYTYPWVVTPLLPGSQVNCAAGTVTNNGSEPYAYPACA
ncbi:hypothetical protein KIK06_17625 [Nocardiopsis sp. EMB25]|uniref:hypothetical protein n=1 Tax=Nocardiopsis sp. EMB25 TaxID=2835867 RepID=UPI0022835D1A|nr:hypothetical protein [Nocardiopsis sp. EMB25]MCY9785709.1 hypothetical protein [Nocardiopsis sp. EMB25]